MRVRWPLDRRLAPSVELLTNDTAGCRARKRFVELRRTCWRQGGRKKADAEVDRKVFVPAFRRTCSTEGRAPSGRCEAGWWIE
jgi:hypothetical protein